MNLRSFFAAWARCAWLDLAIPLVALAQLVLHLWVGAHDGVFRDELYYVAASRHLGFGFVDFPPLVALAAGASRLLLGESVLALRVLPAISGVIVLLLAAAMVREMGGGRSAQLLAAVAVALAPMFIGSSGLMTMDPFDQLWWALCAWTLVRMIRRQEPRLWLLFGLFAGLGLLNKLTMGFYAGALVLGLLLSSQRRLLFNRWLLVGGALAALLISPYIIWNVLNGFPTLEFTRAYSSGKTYQATPFEFLFNQVVISNPLALPLWLGGLYFLFFTRRGSPYRAAGWAYVFLYVLFMIQKAKFYWLGGAYTVLFAAGAYGLELLLTQPRPQVPEAEGMSRRAWPLSTYAWVLVVSGLAAMPLAIPILSPEAFVRYNNFFGGLADRVKQENLATAALPQNYADRYGWHELADEVKAVYEALSPEDQAVACVYTANYGEAAAVDYFAPTHGLPEAVSGHNSYFLWGPQGCTGKVLITVDVAAVDLQPYFETVEQASQTHCEWCLPFENGAPILVARNMKMPLDQVWPVVKSFE